MHRDVPGPGEGLDVLVGLHVGHDQDRDYEDALVELLLDYVADGHGSVPSARHRRFPKGPAPVSDQEPLPIDDQVFPSFDLDPEDADADNPHREVELWGGWEGPDLVEDATI